MTRPKFWWYDDLIDAIYDAEIADILRDDAPVVVRPATRAIAANLRVKLFGAGVTSAPADAAGTDDAEMSPGHEERARRTNHAVLAAMLCNTVGRA